MEIIKPNLNEFGLAYDIPIHIVEIIKDDYRTFKQHFTHVDDVYLGIFFQRDVFILSKGYCYDFKKVEKMKEPLFIVYDRVGRFSSNCY